MLGRLAPPFDEKSIMKRIATLTALFSLVIAVHAQQQEGNKMSFRNAKVIKGSENSIVREIESAVIIPGQTHEDLWVHPNLVTIPGDPIKMEISLRSTDRKGGDRHTVFNYFQTADDFQTLGPIEIPEAEAWQRIGLVQSDFRSTGDEIPKLPKGEWHWARNSVCLGSSTIIYPFLTREGELRSVKTVVAFRRGDTFVPLYVSNALTNKVGRGLLEPQIVQYNGSLYMTMRAEDGFGYVSVSKDEGRSWGEPQVWCWDNREKIDMHTTMTKLLSHSSGLLLVYTRIRRDNSHVFRNRAPLHCADVDPTTLSLGRSTERILIPNKGIPVGNFWVWPIDKRKSYVVVTEWPRDGRKENGDTWLAKIYWKQTNEQMTTEGYEGVSLKRPSNTPDAGDGK